MKNRAFTVIVPDIEGVDEKMWRQYIKDAVGGWKGGFDPEHPLFKLQRETVFTTESVPMANKLRGADLEFVQMVAISVIGGLAAHPVMGSFPTKQLVRMAYQLGQDMLEERLALGLVPGFQIED